MLFATKQSRFASLPTGTEAFTMGAIGFCLRFSAKTKGAFIGLVAVFA